MIVCSDNFCHRHNFWIAQSCSVPLNLMFEGYRGSRPVCVQSFNFTFILGKWMNSQGGKSQQSIIKLCCGEKSRWRASTVVVWLKKFSARCASMQCSGSVHVVSWVFSLRAVCWQPHPAGKFQALSIIKNVRHAGHADTLPSEFGLFYWVAILITSDDPLLKLDEFEREVDICSLHKFLVCVVSLWITCEKIV